MIHGSGLAIYKSLSFNFCVLFPRMKVLCLFAFSFALIGCSFNSDSEKDFLIQREREHLEEIERIEHQKGIKLILCSQCRNNIQFDEFGLPEFAVKELCGECQLFYFILSLPVGSPVQFP